MRRWVSLMIVASIPLLALGAERKGTGPLTKEEIADGWVNLFDGETTFGWKIDGEAKVEKGELVVGGDKEMKIAFKTHVLGGTVYVEAEQEGKSVITAFFGKYGGMTVDKEDKPAKNPLASGFIHPKYDGFHGNPASPLAFTIPAGGKLRLRRAVYKPEALTDLFDGKTLAGWKVFEGKGKTSVFAVKDGLLNVKNGPGDIQSEKSFGDFVLQVTARTNGKHLNSGIFFRCQPGKYQQGYEAQIRHEFTEKPTQKYAVEDFDPMTHKSLGKRDVMAHAVDYGTGAIYRRVPARKVPVKDGEWFTMTIVARGRHVSTWVNGVQAADWTDNRAPGDNGRNGYREAAGPISIQGHDPTTDLDFKSIRVIELPRAKK